MKTLFESMMRPDVETSQAVEFEAVLKKYRWLYKSAKWEGKTLCISDPGNRVYLDDLDKVAEELNCKSFKIYPWAIIETSGTLDGLTIEAGTRIDIKAPKVTGCKLQCPQQVTIKTPDKSQKPIYTNNDFVTKFIDIEGVNGVTFSGNNFNDVIQLELTKVGPKIENIVMSWNFITNKLSGGVWSTYPKPNGAPKMDLDPMKALGLDRHFKNVTRLIIAGGKHSGTQAHLEFVNKGSSQYNHYRDGYYEVGMGIMDVKYLTSGWQMIISQQ